MYLQLHFTGICGYTGFLTVSAFLRIRQTECFGLYFPASWVIPSHDEDDRAPPDFPGSWIFHCSKRSESQGIRTYAKPVQPKVKEEISESIIFSWRFFQSIIKWRACMAFPVLEKSTNEWARFLGILSVSCKFKALVFPPLSRNKWKWRWHFQKYEWISEPIPL